MLYTQAIDPPPVSFYNTSENSNTGNLSLEKGTFLKIKLCIHPPKIIPMAPLLNYRVT